MKKPVIVIVDAYSTGQHLAPMLIEQGYECIHIQSTRIIPNRYYEESFFPEHFIAHLIADDGIHSIQQNLAQYPVKHVMAGSETGVEFADLLSESLGLLSNGTRKSTSRRSKFDMAKTLVEAGVKAVPHFISADVEQIIDWQKTLNSYPIVLKPDRSSAADHVIFCHNDEEIRKAFKAIVNSKTVFNVQNEQVLAQDFLQGAEYIVNTSSTNGIHYVAEIWKCRKERIEGAGYISRLEELQAYGQSHHVELATYAKQVLDAIEIKYGPGHFEIMLTAEGPILIEVAARLQGCVDPRVISQATGGDNNVSLAIDSYINPHKIIAKADKPYPLKQFVFRIFMKSYQEGLLSQEPNVELIKNLASYSSSEFYVQKNDRVKKTIDLDTSPGVVHLMNADLEQLEKDYLTYCQIEENDLFVTITSPEMPEPYTQTHERF